MVTVERKLNFFLWQLIGHRRRRRHPKEKDEKSLNFYFRLIVSLLVTRCPFID
jgi:hypothetical protein